MSETLQDVQLWILTAVLLLGAGTKAVDRTAQGPAVLLPVPLRRPPERWAVASGGAGPSRR